jgi:hypothetical protein
VFTRLWCLRPGRSGRDQTAVVVSEDIRRMSHLSRSRRVKLWAADILRILDTTVVLDVS